MSTPPAPDDDPTALRPPAAPTLPAAPAGPPTMPSVPATRPAPAPASTAGDHALPLGTRLGEFEITQRIGEGGFSVVYLAWDHSLERHVALKEYLPFSIASRSATTLVSPRSENHRETFEAGLRSFINEAKLLAQFDHPSLVKVYRFWEANGTAYMVMPYYQGRTVRDTVRALGQSPDEAWIRGLLRPLCEALRVIHAAQCFHRDIAPDNVILLADTGRPLLLDFGAARRVVTGMTQALTVILKPGYAPIEQYDEVPGMKQGPWTDVYALGAVVHWLVTGKTPPASVGRLLRDAYVPLAELAADRYSAPFLAAVDRALAVMPEQRTASIDEFLRDLDTAAPTAAPEPAPEPARAVTAPAAAPTGPRPDEDATVLRNRPPVAAEPVPASVAPAPPPMVAAPAPQDPLAVLAALDETPPPRAAVAPPAAVSPPQRPAPPPASTARTAGPRVGVAVAALAVVAAAGWWWSQGAPTPATAAPPDATATAPATAPAAAVAAPNPGPVPAPAAAPPSSSPPALAPPAPNGVDTAPAPATAATVVEPTPQPPAPRPAAPRPAAQNAPRATDPANAANAQNAQNATNAAECAAILQRMSLGETGTELIERIKTLGCR